MIETIRAEIRRRYPELADGAGPSVLQIGGASWRGGRVHFAVFGRDGAPALFARVMRNPADDPRLVREHELLNTLAAHSECARHVPAPAFLSRVGGRTLLCERAAPGRSMSMQAGLVRSRLPDAATLTLATRLTIAIARASGEIVESERLRALALDPLREFWLSAGGAAGEIDPLLDEVVEASGPRPRLVVTHGDFIAKNILVDGTGAAVVIDWETAQPHGLPLLDLFYFLTRSAYVGGPVWRHKIDRVRAFYGSAAPPAVRDSLASYCTVLDVPAALIAPIYRLHFLYKARIKAETTSLDNPVTQRWLDLFRESAQPGIPAALRGS